MAMSGAILEKLEGGDHRSLLQVILVAEAVEDNSALLADLFEGAVSPVG